MLSLEGTSAIAFFVHPKESAPPATAAGPPTLEQPAPAPDTQAPPSTPAPATTQGPSTPAPATTQGPSTPAPATTQGPSTPAPATTQAPSTAAPASQNSVTHHDESNQECSFLRLCWLTLGSVCIPYPNVLFASTRPTCHGHTTHGVCVCVHIYAWVSVYVYTHAQTCMHVHTHSSNKTEELHQAHSTWQDRKFLHWVLQFACVRVCVCVCDIILYIKGWKEGSWCFMPSQPLWLYHGAPSVGLTMTGSGLLI